MLYIGSLRRGSTATARMQALQAAGCEIVPFDINATIRPARWWQKQLAYKLSRGPLPAHLNRNLLLLARGQQAGLDYVWVDKGMWLYRETLEEIQAATGAVLVHYTPDPQVSFQVEKLHHFHRTIPLYDILFTTKPFDVDGYRRLGARNVMLVDQSYDDDDHRPRELNAQQRAQFGSEVCFIGQYTDHYAGLLRIAVSTGAKVKLWGPNWRRRLWRNRWLADTFAGDGLWDESYSLALSGADIGLCFLSKRYAETTTTRTFEIPACGTFMLAERTADHQRLFTEGVEAEFFGDAAELSDKIGFYLANPRARGRIAAAGRERCLRSGYGNQSRMRSLFAAAQAAGPAGVAV